MGVELDISGVVLAVPALAPRPPPAVRTLAPRAPSTANRLHPAIFQRDIRLLRAVPQADRLDARLVKYVVEPLKVPRRVVRAWLAARGDLSAAAGAAVVVGDRGGVRHGPDVMGVEICPQA